MTNIIKVTLVFGIMIASSVALADFEKLRADRCKGLKELASITKTILTNNAERYAEALSNRKRIADLQEAGKASYQELNDAKRDVRILSETRGQILDDLDVYLVKTIQICGYR